jgi:hypothetical protein
LGAGADPAFGAARRGIIIAVTDQREWRPSRGSRIGLYLAAAGFLALGVFMVVIAAEDGALVVGIGIGVVMGLLPAVVALRFARRIRLVAQEDALMVVSFANEKRLPWSDVVEAEAGYSGITIGLRDGTAVLSGAVQKANISTWFGRRTRADEVVEYINDRAGAADLR